MEGPDRGRRRRTFYLERESGRAGPVSGVVQRHGSERTQIREAAEGKQSAAAEEGDVMETYSFVCFVRFRPSKPHHDRPHFHPLSYAVSNGRHEPLSHKATPRETLRCGSANEVRARGERLTPKMLTKRTLTSWSLRQMLIPILALSALAPPPPSRKFAG